MAQQLRDLETLRLSVADESPNRSVLLKVVDVEHGELTRVVHVTASERAAA